MATLKKVQTRQAVECPIFGCPKDLNDNVLPSYEDIMKCYLYIRQELRALSEKEPTVGEITDKLVPKVERIWARASIPVVSQTRVSQMIKSYHEKYRNLLKSKGRKGTQKYDSNLNTFRINSKQLFDIAACKCSDFARCECEKIKKVPIIEKAFLQDQRSQRQMVIRGVDKATTKKIAHREIKKQEQHFRILKYREETSDNIRMKLESLRSAKETNEFDLDPKEESEEEVSPVGLPSSSAVENSHLEPSTLQMQMRVKLPSLASICDRTGVSDRTAAAIASAVLEDIGLITPLDNSKVIDRMKVRRERKRNRERLIVKSRHETDELQNVRIKGLYFDGRKNHTIVQEKKGTKYYRRTISEEHISLVEEPESKYLGHVTPESSTALNIKTSIVSFLREKQINITNITTVGCDGTATNTGSTNGIISLLEKEMGRPLQWIVCLFHGNELPFRHLCRFLSGKTTGPARYAGDIGDKIGNCEELPLVNFKPIQGYLPEILMVLKDLSTDQKYLLEICQAISSGICSPDLAKRNPGKLCHSRWLTTANRILRLYIGSENPSEELYILTEYVMKVYAPVWFNIKLKPSCVHGSQHLWRLIKLSRYLPQHLLDIIDPVIQRNGYFAAPENLLLGLLTDKRKNIRELALRRILKARTIHNDGIRKFKIPVINFDANDYVDLISWHNCEIIEPPMIQQFEEDELRHLVEITSENCTETDLPIKFSQFPCHTQAVERMVKLVTEASSVVCGETARDGFIMTKIESQKLMSSFETKKQFRLKTFQ